MSTERDKDFNYERWVDDLKNPPSDLWLTHLAADSRMVADFARYLDVQIYRAQAHAMNIKGEDIRDDLLRLQGGVRALATVKLFVTSFVRKQSENSSRVESSRAERAGGSDAGSDRHDPKSGSS